MDISAKHNLCLDVFSFMQPAVGLRHAGRRRSGRGPAALRSVGFLAFGEVQGFLRFAIAHGGDFPIPREAPR